MFAAFKRVKISTKLSGVVGAALLALCVMGAIAVLAAREIQQLGHGLRVESAEFARTESTVLVDVERAISEVHSAPSELDLNQLKGKQQRLVALVNEVDTTVQAALRETDAADILAGGKGLIAAVRAFEVASNKVFDFAASFAQPDAIAALANTVGPAEATVQDALRQLRTAFDRRSAAKDAGIQAKIATLTTSVVSLAALLVIALATLAYLTVSRGVTRPISRIGNVLLELANGNKTVEIPYTDRGDEVGNTARAARTFKERLLQMAQMEADQKELERRTAEERQAAEQRAAAEKRAAADNEEAAGRAAIQKVVTEFESAVGGIIELVSASATELEETAATLAATAEGTNQLANAVATASEEASVNVQTAATSADQMMTSVDEIGRQVQVSSEIARHAVAQAEKTDLRVTELSRAATRIGDVVNLITAIAEQTNLLALNATIEAARAGEAGRGFAVVAQEVKALAAQTAKATSDISAQITGMQTATQESVQAIKEIGDTIGKISEISGTIASAMAEQEAATREIARNVDEAAKGTRQVSSNIAEVNRHASETGAASTEMLSSAQSLSREGSHLKNEMDRFINMVRTGLGRG